MTKVKYITKAVNANINACTITDAAITDNCSIHIVTSPSTVPILNAYQDGNNVVVKFQPQAEPFNIRAEVSIINEFKVDINGDDDDAMPATAEVGGSDNAYNIYWNSIHGNINVGNALEIYYGGITDTMNQANNAYNRANEAWNLANNAGGGDFNFNYNVYAGHDEETWEPYWNEVNTSVTAAISNIYANACGLYLPEYAGNITETFEYYDQVVEDMYNYTDNIYNQANNAYDWANNSYNKANDAFNIGYATLQVASDAYNQANAAFQYGNNRKNEVGAAVTAKGGTWSSTYDWNNTVNSIATIPSGGGDNPRYKVYEYTAEINELGNYYIPLPAWEWAGWTGFGRGGTFRWLGSDYQRYGGYGGMYAPPSLGYNYWANVSGYWNICVNMVDRNGVYINIVNFNTLRTNYNFYFRFVKADLCW